MDLWFGILIGMVLGIWLSVLSLYLYSLRFRADEFRQYAMHPNERNGWEEMEAVPRRQTGRRESQTAGRARRSPDPGQSAPSPAKPARPPMVMPASDPTGYQVTYGEIDRQSNTDPVVKEELTYLLHRAHGDREQVLRLIRYEQQRRPDRAIVDWVTAAAGRWRRDDR